MSDRNLGPLSGGSPLVLIDTADPTIVHAAGAADIGRLRGVVVHLHISNSNAAARDVTISDGTTSEVLTIAAKTIAELDFWLPAGETVTAQASGSDVYVSGYARTVA
jgi:hypothetical protein